MRREGVDCPFTLSGVSLQPTFVSGTCRGLRNVATTPSQAKRKHLFDTPAIAHAYTRTGKQRTITSSVATRVLGYDANASPEFVAVHGEPGSPEDLDPAFCIGVLGEQSVASEWQFRKGAMETTVTPAARLVCGDLQIAAAVAVRSGGLVRLPALAVESQIAAGLLMSLLPARLESGSRQYVCVSYVSPATVSW